ncbi:MAG: hypothetical protein ACRCYU_04095 [Nocardioides sp.]
MIDADPVPEPGGLKVINEWLDELYTTAPGRRLWAILDDRLRLTLAQGWLLGHGGPDDDLAEDLADYDAAGQLFDQMFVDLIQHWRSAYAGLRHGRGVMDRAILVGADLELVVLLAPEYIGDYPDGARVPGHSFITRLEADEWLIAALARRLPVPGWPPTEESISWLPIDP